MSKARYLWNIINGTKRAMVNAGAREEACPHCGRLTPIYRHQGYKGVSSCLWCGQSIDERFCQICECPYREGEATWVDYHLGIYGGAHEACLKKLRG